MKKKDNKLEIVRTVGVVLMLCIQLTMLIHQIGLLNHV